ERRAEAGRGAGDVAPPGVGGAVHGASRPRGGLMPHVSVRGVRLYHEWHGSGPGAPLVLVMGLGGDVTAWGLQLAAFAPRHRCLVFDTRGAGRSDAPDAPYSTAEMATDLWGLCDALAVTRAHLLGVSMGGAIVQAAALAAPERVASLQLHCTWAGPDPY